MTSFNIYDRPKRRRVPTNIPPYPGPKKGKKNRTVRVNLGKPKLLSRRTPKYTGAELKKILRQGHY